MGYKTLHLLEEEKFITIKALIKASDLYDKLYALNTFYDVKWKSFIDPPSISIVLKLNTNKFCGLQSFKFLYIFSNNYINNGVEVNCKQTNEFTIFLLDNILKETKRLYFEQKMKGVLL